MRPIVLVVLAALAGAATATTVPSGTLIPTIASPMAANGNTCCIATGDFNGDGKLDMAVANENAQTGTVTILLGDGAGGFRVNAIVVVGQDPCSIAAGDFNGDRVPDLVVVNSIGASVSVLLGDGHGGFQQAAGSPIVNSLMRAPRAVAVGDFNSDAKLDLMVGDISGNSVWLLLGNGAGGFTFQSTPIVAGYGPAWIAAGDFNRDGRTDLAVVNQYAGPFPGTPGGFPPSGNTVTVLLGNGQGGFSAAPGSPFAVGLVPTSVISADWNGDGNPDLAVTSQAKTVTVLLGNGFGGFTPAPGGPLVTPSVSLSVAAGDLNGDGFADLAVGTNSNGNESVEVFLGNGTGSFAAVAGLFSSGPAGAGTVAADFNGDGRLDVAVADIVKGVTVFLGAPVPTVAMLSSPAQATIQSGGQTIPLRAQVNPNLIAFAAPSGTVTFQDGATRLATVTLVNGVATFDVTNVSFAPHSFSAVYSGDARSVASTSNTLSFAPPPIVISGVANGASFQPGVLAPNTILSLFGSNLGCAGGAQVLVDGVPAEVLAAADTQINFVAPPGVASSPAPVQVACGANRSQPYPMPAAAAAPAVFTAAQSGAGQASVLNQDFSVNGPASPAARGDYISIYGTGLGQYAATGADGLTRMTQPVLVFFGTVSASPQFAGQAPGYTAGLQQINVQIPDGVPAGAVPISVTVGAARTQQSITVAIMDR